MSETTQKTRPAAPKVGDVIRTGRDRFSLVVGSEKVRHVHTDRNGEQGETIEREHPLVVDLPAARRHELDPYTED